MNGHAHNDLAVTFGLVDIARPREKERNMRARYFLVVAALFFGSPVMAESWVNNSSNYCLDTDGRAANGGSVRMWHCEQHPNQSWTVSPVSAGSFRLKNRGSNFCLDTDGLPRNGGPVRMWGCADHPNQLWEIQNLPADHYQLKNKASGFCLDTDGAAANGGAVRMWQCADHPHQSWTNTAGLDELNQISRTGTFGGPGGGPFELACPDGSFMTGLRARSGAWLDALSPVCSRWVRRSETLGEIDDQPFTGGGGGGETFIRCEGRRGVIVGIQMFQADNSDGSLGNMVVDCGDYKQPSQFWNKLGGSADYLGVSQRGPRVEKRRGWGLVAAGIYGKSGAFIDRLGLLCRRPR
ncbi:MAG TPA: RICIN domain-containing protein [Thermoanaerobaculia bacterium]|nr:RICIN domain-containing protein [Thermoanaerobaculia bacterium]